MADPRLYDGPAAAEFQEATRELRALLADAPGGETPYAETFGNPYLIGSPAALLEAAANDQQVRDAHGLTSLVGSLVCVVADQQRQIGEMKAATGEGLKPGSKAGR